MGIRRITMVFSERQRGRARKVFELLSAKDATCFDATILEAGNGRLAVEAVAVQKDVAPLLAFLGKVAGVGTAQGATVAIGDMLATVPPIDQRIAMRAAEEAMDTEVDGCMSPPLPPAVTRNFSKVSFKQALTADEVRARMTVDEIFTQIDSSSHLSFECAAACPSIRRAWGCRIW